MENATRVGISSQENLRPPFVCLQHSLTNAQHTTFHGIHLRDNSHCIVENIDQLVKELRNSCNRKPYYTNHGRCKRKNIVHQPNFIGKFHYHIKLNLSALGWDTILALMARNLNEKVDDHTKAMSFLIKSLFPITQS